jgi:peptide/nickel transport system substrate-binding protein
MIFSAVRKKAVRFANNPPYRDETAKGWATRTWARTWTRIYGRLIVVGCLLMVGCRGRVEGPGSVVMIIESSPNNLDLRQGTDAQSERVGGQIFDALVKKDEHYELQPWLATSWEQPDALTWVFHLRDGVRFHDGRPLEAADVAYTIESLIDGTLVTAKGASFAAVDRAEARDRLTVVVKMKRPDSGLLFNMSDGLFGVVPRGSGKDFGLHPVGSGPFKFVSAVQDKEVIVERNHDYWADRVDAMRAVTAGTQRIERIRFTVVPDTITSALELKKGSADLASNVVTLDMVHTLEAEPNLKVESGAGSPVVYVTFNVTYKLLKDKRVRQAVACAIDRQAIVDAIWRGQARLANTLLPTGHWAAAIDDELAQAPSYHHDVVRAQRLLEEAGFPAGKDGVRMRLTMKTSTDETTRLMAAVLQQQLRAAGIQLEIRSAEFGTFYADVTKGAFQIYALRWIGSNEDPDIFRYAYGSGSFPPKGGNRGRYSNSRVDALLAEASASSDRTVRKKDYVEVQQILAEELPGIPLWYPNNEVVHTRRVVDVRPRASGNFDFLREAEVTGDAAR